MWIIPVNIVLSERSQSQRTTFYMILFVELFLLFSRSAAAAKSLQSCPTLCDPTDGSPSGSSVPGILQARTLEWVAISFSNAWQWKVKVKSLSCVQFFVTPWTVASQAPLSMGFSRQEYYSGCHFVLHGTFTTQGSNLCLLHWRNRRVETQIWRSLPESRSKL